MPETFTAGAPLLIADEPYRQEAVDNSWYRINSKARVIQTLVEKAARTLNVPIAAVSIIDRKLQRFAAKTGLNVDETDRDIAFCAHAIHSPGETMVVPDATEDPRFANNPLVTGDPGIRFYAGKPLVTYAGFPIGTLCVIDTRPQDAPENIYELTLIAHEVERLLEPGRV